MEKKSGVQVDEQAPSPAPAGEAAGKEEPVRTGETAGKEEPVRTGEAELFTDEPAEAPATDVGQDREAGLRAELEAERRQRLEIEDRALRWRADYENLRRRTQLEAEQSRIQMAQDLIGRLLPVLDDLDLALANAESEAPPSWVEGLRMVQRRFLAVLAEQGLTRMETVNQPFDPERHEAMSRVEDSGHPPNTIVEEMRPGYLLGARVIRPALVKVQV